MTEKEIIEAAYAIQQYCLQRDESKECIFKGAKENRAGDGFGLEIYFNQEVIYD